MIAWRLLDDNGGCQCDCVCRWNVREVGRSRGDEVKPVDGETCEDNNTPLNHSSNNELLDEEDSQGRRRSMYQ